MRKRYDHGAKVHETNTNFKLGSIEFFQNTTLSTWKGAKVLASTRGGNARMHVEDLQFGIFNAEFFFQEALNLQKGSLFNSTLCFARVSVVERFQNHVLECTFPFLPPQGRDTIVIAAMRWVERAYPLLVIDDQRARVDDRSKAIDCVALLMDCDIVPMEQFQMSAKTVGYSEYAAWEICFVRDEFRSFFCQCVCMFSARVENLEESGNGTSVDGLKNGFKQEAEISPLLRPSRVSLGFHLSTHPSAASFSLQQQDNPVVLLVDRSLIVQCGRAI
jgi:hypothetical protein